jgi:hypothetical protein
VVASAYLTVRTDSATDTVYTVEAAPWEDVKERFGDLSAPAIMRFADADYIGRNSFPSAPHRHHSITNVLQRSYLYLTSPKMTPHGWSHPFTKLLAPSSSEKPDITSQTCLPKSSATEKEVSPTSWTIHRSDTINPEVLLHNFSLLLNSTRYDTTPYLPRLHLSKSNFKDALKTAAKHQSSTVTILPYSHCFDDSEYSILLAGKSQLCHLGPCVYSDSSSDGLCVRKCSSVDASVRGRIVGVRLEMHLGTTEYVQSIVEALPPWPVNPTFAAKPIPLGLVSDPTQPLTCAEEYAIDRPPASGAVSCTSDPKQQRKFKIFMPTNPHPRNHDESHTLAVGSKYVLGSLRVKYDDTKFTLRYGTHLGIDGSGLIGLIPLVISIDSVMPNPGVPVDKAAK